MTALDSWMAQRNKDNGWLVELLGVSESQASRIRRGLSRPSLAGAAKLNKATRIPVATFAELATEKTEGSGQETAGAG